MKTKFMKVMSYVLQVVLTSLASAGIALLQSYIESKGVNMGPTLTPENTAIVGGAVASTKVAIQSIRNNCFF